tara:strand:- start:2238 stop:2756 length:519 start_codon:yes stop_codon:yes gene_type:complete
MIYFVTEDYLKSKTPITANVDVTVVSPWIEPACETRVEPMLGNYFFNDLLVKYNAETLSPDEIALVAVLKKCIAWRAAALAVYGVSRPLKNTGIQILDSENSKGVNLEEVTFGIAQYDGIAADYQSKLRKYLIANKAKFAKFTAEENKDSTLWDICQNSKEDDGYNDTIMVI